MKTLEQAAEDFVWEVMENDEAGISDLCQKLRPTSKISDFYDALAEFFKAGAKWQQKQGAKGYVMKSASPVCKEDKPQRLITILYDETEDNYVRAGDKIIIQIKKL